MGVLMSLFHFWHLTDEGNIWIRYEIYLISLFCIKVSLYIVVHHNISEQSYTCCCSSQHQWTELHMLLFITTSVNRATHAVVHHNISEQSYTCCCSARVIEDLLTPISWRNTHWYTPMQELRWNGNYIPQCNWDYPCFMPLPYAQACAWCNQERH